MRSLAICAAVLLVAQLAAARNVWDIPGGLSKGQTPQFVIFTHDDNTDAASAKLVRDITDRHKNPNGCKINAAFYTTSSLSTCAAVMSLYKDGHEIGEHTTQHKALSDQSKSEKTKAIVDARNWIIKCGVPASQVVGHRSPYLKDDADVRAILANNGFLYDTSILEIFNSPSSPSASRRLWPYGLSGGIKQMFSCKWFDNTNGCSASEKPKISEIPMWVVQKGAEKPAASDVMDYPNAYENYKRELDRNMKGNRAPVGIFTHSTTTGYLTKSNVRAELNKFLTYARGKPDVWVVTPRQLLDWTKNPVPVSKMASFMAKYKCNK